MPQAILVQTKIVLFERMVSWQSLISCVNFYEELLNRVFVAQYISFLMKQWTFSFHVCNILFFV